MISVSLRSISRCANKSNDKSHGSIRIRIKEPCLETTSNLEEVVRLCETFPEACKEVSLLRSSTRKCNNGRPDPLFFSIVLQRSVEASVYGRRIKTNPVGRTSRLPFEVEATVLSDEQILRQAEIDSRKYARNRALHSKELTAAHVEFRALSLLYRSLSGPGRRRRAVSPRLS